MERKELFTIKVYAEKSRTMLNRITGIIARKALTIEAMEVKEVQDQSIYFYAIKVRESSSEIKN